MYKKFSKIIITIVCLMLVLVMVGCQAPAKPAAPAEEPAKAPEAEQPAQAPEEGKKKVALLLPGVIYDKSWSQNGYEGLLAAEKDCGIAPAYTESVQQAGQTEAFRNYAQQGYDIIIGHGSQFTDAALTVAKEFPEIDFVVVNSMLAEGNVSAISADYMHMGYLAGVLACNMSKTKHVAILQDVRLPIMDPVYASFPMGVKTCGEDYKTTISVFGAMGDTVKAREASLALIAEGADVIWGNMNEEIAGVFSAAEDKGIYTIGLYTDMYESSPKTVIGSTVFYPDKEVYEAACGKINDGTVHFLSMNIPNAMDIILTKNVPDDVAAKVEAARQDLRDGKIEFPDYLSTTQH
ncbi:MAG: BMP family protein [Anaerolineaceae bacterium]|jgi:basic membrane protein A